MDDWEHACDDVVIGAGAAGLLAARELARAGRAVCLVEASDRVGGRIREAFDPRALGPIELGAEFVHGRPPVTHALLREIGVAVIDTADTSFIWRDGSLRRPAGDPFASAAAVLTAAVDGSADESVEAAIARAVGSGAATLEAAALTRRLVAGFDAADPARASARVIAAEWAGDAGADSGETRPVGGYAPLIAHLSRSLETQRVSTRLQTIVERVCYGGAGVTVAARGPGGRVTIRAQRVLVTVSAGVLAADTTALGAIAFDPPLPAQIRRALEHILMGPVVKVVLLFRDAFWETLDGGAFRDGAFFTDEGPFQSMWTQLPLRANTLTAWAGGPNAEVLDGLDRAALIAKALDNAATVFGDEHRVRAAFANAFVHDWQRDPFTRGAYSYVTVGGDRAREILGQPVGERLFLAGEATATQGEGGTVAGAFISGLRAAQLMLAR